MLPNSYKNHTYLCVISKALFTDDSLINILAVNEDSDAIPNNATFHQVLHCLLRQRDLQRN